MASPQGNDRVGAANGPEHAGLFETGTDDGFAGRFDHARAYEQVLAAKLGIPHALGIPLKVIRLDANLLGQLGMV